MLYKMKDITKRILESDIGKNSLQIYVIQFFSLGIGMIVSIITARTLGSFEKGLVDLFALLNSFILDFGLLGAGSGLLYYLANRNEKLEKVHGTGVYLCVILGIVTIIIGMLISNMLQRVFPGLSTWMIYLSFIIAPIAYYRLIWSNIMIGINKVVDSHKLNLLFSCIALFAIFILYITNAINASSIIILNVVITIFSALFGFVFIYRVSSKLQPDYTLAIKSLKYGLAIYIGILANIINFRIDQIMVNYWLGSSSLGIYTVSIRWAELLFLLDSAIITASMYKVSSLPTEDSYKLTKKIFRVQIVISSASALLLAMFSYPLVYVLYGYAFIGAVRPLLILIPGIVLWSITKALSTFISYKLGKVKLLTYCAILGCILNVFFNWLFISILNFGISGAAIATSISYSVVCVYIYVLFIRLSK